MALGERSWLSVPDKDDGRTLDNALGVDLNGRESYVKQSSVRETRIRSEEILLSNAPLVVQCSGSR